MYFYKRKQKKAIIQKLTLKEDDEAFKTSGNKFVPTNNADLPKYHKAPATLKRQEVDISQQLFNDKDSGVQVYAAPPKSKQKEVVLEGFGPGKAKPCISSDKKSFYTLRLHAIPRAGKRGSIAAAPREFAAADLDEHLPFSDKCHVPKPRNEYWSEMCDLRVYKSLPLVLEENYQRPGYELFKHSIIACQPNLVHEIRACDPSTTPEEKLRLIKKEREAVDIRLAKEIAKQRAREKKREQEDALRLPIISENTYRTRFPELAQQVVPYDINGEYLRDELYIAYGWAGESERLKDIHKKLLAYRNIHPQLQSQSERAKEIIAMQRLAIAGYRAPVKPNNAEYFDEYARQLAECRIPTERPPAHIPEPRVRRVIMEGSYPNWTVEENRLPRLLRFSWKAKLAKLQKYLQDERNHHKINNVDDIGRTALHYAASWGCVRTLNLLLQVPGIKLNERDEHGKTPLYKAVEINSIECVKALMDRGANCKIQARDTRDPLTSVMHFHGDQRIDMFKFLYEYGRYREDDVEPYFVSLLHKALATGVNVVNIVNFLIESGEDVNAIEGRARTPLHLACAFERCDLILLLLTHGANMFYIDENYKRAIDYAPKETLSRDIMNEFYEYGPQPLEVVLACRDNGGNFDASKILRKPRRQQA